MDLLKKRSGQAEPETISELKLNVPDSMKMAPAPVAPQVESTVVEQSDDRPPPSNRRVIQPRAPVSAK